MAELLKVAVLVMLFDFTYFFHHLAYEMAEVWKRRFGMQARAAQGGTHPEVLDLLAELVMAMGWTCASLIAQDVASALVRRLGKHVSELLRAHVGEAREGSKEFDTMWKARLALLHNDYGSHATLIAPLH